MIRDHGRWLSHCSECRAPHSHVQCVCVHVCAHTSTRGTSVPACLPFPENSLTIGSGNLENSVFSPWFEGPLRFTRFRRASVIFNLLGIISLNILTFINTSCENTWPDYCQIRRWGLGRSPENANLCPIGESLLGAPRRPSKWIGGQQNQVQLQFEIVLA